jgi:voltage-gated potassium channel
MLLVYVAGVVGWLAFGVNFVDALTATSLTMTTVGFSVGRALTSGEKLFTVGIALGGVSAFLAFLAVLSGEIVEGRLGVGRRRRRMERRIEDLRDHFILCAYGRVGRAAARELEAEGMPFVVIDRKEELEELLRSDGMLYLIGDPTHESVLLHAGIERAKALLCAVDSDADSVYITLTARSLNAKLFIVARAGEPDSPGRLMRAGADRVISPYVTSGRHMVALGLRPRVLDYVEIATSRDPRARLEEVMIDAGSPLEGRTVAEAAGGALPLLLRRSEGGTVPNPQATDRVNAGDLLVLFGEGERRTLERTDRT